ncbi:hypothetical protein BCR42DRAFT_454821 [Absidia repens]|uniref:Uncharacterized protein n=1 Tax=Absidia repens TaxID=90262 RepID=A0A1X2I5M0_9FUNG|nr:hypothetical protein BCR42DRAFT_454821 [Absidia repens]
MVSLPQSASTNKTILDQLLYLSIQSRLDQHDPTQQKSSHRAKHEKHKKAVESIVTGILSSHRNNMKNNYNLDTQFRQRLDLCRLTHTVFGRYDPTQVRDPSTTWKKTKDEHPTCSKLYQAQPLASHCRLHRSLLCPLCPTKPQPPSVSPTTNHSSSPKSHHRTTPTTTTTTTITTTATCRSSALIHAIPLFLKTSADLLRLALNEQQKSKAPMITLAGEKVIGGGLPQAWYELFLDLLTQAAIEAYLCDGQVGMESIVDIFSHGYVEDEDEPDLALSDDDDDDDDDEEEEQEQDGDYCPDSTLWSVPAADHHLLFPKTRSMFLFKSQVWQREQEFLIAGDGVNLQDHFHRLAQTYPVESFDQSMRSFIQRMLNTMDIPILERDKTTRQASASPLTCFLDIGTDGSLFMPETALDDDPSTSSLIQASKRRHSLDPTFPSSPPFKKQKI